MNFSDLVGFSSVVQDTLGGGRFTCVNVGHDPDVTVHREGDFAFFGGGGFGEVNTLSVGYSCVVEDEQ